MSISMSNKMLTVAYLMDEMENPRHKIQIPVQAKAHPFEFITAVLHYCASANPEDLQNFIRGEKIQVDLAVSEFDKLVLASHTLTEKKLNVNNMEFKSNAYPASGSSFGDAITATAQKTTQEKKSRKKYQKGNVLHSFMSALQVDATSSSTAANKANFVRFIAAILVKLYDSRAFSNRVSSTQRKNDLGEYIVSCYKDYKNLAGNNDYWSQRIALKGDYLKFFPHAVPEGNHTSVIDDSGDDELIDLPVINANQLNYIIPIEASLINLPTFQKIAIKEAEVDEQNLRVTQLEIKLDSAKKVLGKVVDELTELKVQHSSEEEAKKTILLIKDSKFGYSTFESAKQLIGIYEKLEQIISTENMIITPIQLMDKISKINVTDALRVDKCLKKTLVDLNTATTDSIDQDNDIVKELDSILILLDSNKEVQDISINPEDLNAASSNGDKNPTIHVPPRHDSQVDIVEIDEDLIRETTSVVGKRSLIDEQEETNIKRRRVEDAVALENLLMQ